VFEGKCSNIEFGDGKKKSGTNFEDLLTLD